MLRAYDYAESNINSIEYQSPRLFQQEKQIAQNYVITHPVKNCEKECPICGMANTRFIFERWDVNYHYCENCASIYVPIDEETALNYLELKEMKELRKSVEYQSQALEKRNDIWAELAMWAEFRTFRYIGRNKGLNIIDYGNKYSGLVEKFYDSGMCGKYELRDSFLDINNTYVDKADVVLYLNQLQHERNPVRSLRKIRESLKEDGILILNTRLGSGFDILTLKGGADDIFPYEHIMLPSKKGLEIILEKSGYELLEITTPGTRDMNVVLKNKERIEDSNFFVKYLLDTAETSVLSDFQQFLQKSGLSSFAQVVAKKKESTDRKRNG